MKQAAQDIRFKPASPIARLAWGRDEVGKDGIEYSFDSFYGVSLVCLSSGSERDLLTFWDKFEKSFFNQAKISNQNPTREIDLWLSEVFDSIDDSAKRVLRSSFYSIEAELLPSRKCGETVDASLWSILLCYRDALPTKGHKSDFIQVVPNIIKSLCLVGSATFSARIPRASRPVQSAIIRPYLLDERLESTTRASFP